MTLKYVAFAVILRCYEETLLYCVLLLEIMFLGLVFCVCAIVLVTLYLLSTAPSTLYERDNRCATSQYSRRIWQYLHPVQGSWIQGESKWRKFKEACDTFIDEVVTRLSTTFPDNNMMGDFQPLNPKESRLLSPEEATSKKLSGCVNTTMLSLTEKQLWLNGLYCLVCCSAPCILI